MSLTPEERAAAAQTARRWPKRHANSMIWLPEEKRSIINIDDAATYLQQHRDWIQYG